VVDLCVGSRFLEFPIQIVVAEIVYVRGTRPAHAPTGNEVGGYVRKRAKLGSSQWVYRRLAR
jgi:hypothetical protein